MQSVEETKEKPIQLFEEDAVDVFQVKSYPPKYCCPSLGIQVPMFSIYDLCRFLVKSGCIVSSGYVESDSFLGELIAKPCQFHLFTAYQRKKRQKEKAG